jgi:hypothetical protein
MELSRSGAAIGGHICSPLSGVEWAPGFAATAAEGDGTSAAAKPPGGRLKNHRSPITDRQLLSVNRPSPLLSRAQRQAAQAVEIYTRWDRFGFLATCHEFEHFKPCHCVGALVAAHELARTIFGPVHYRMSRVRKGLYLAERRVP